MRFERCVSRSWFCSLFCCSSGHWAGCLAVSFWLCSHCCLWWDGNPTLTMCERSLFTYWSRDCHIQSFKHMYTFLSVMLNDIRKIYLLNLMCCTAEFVLRCWPSSTCPHTSGHHGEALLWCEWTVSCSSARSFPNFFHLKYLLKVPPEI